MESNPISFSEAVDSIMSQSNEDDPTRGVDLYKKNMSNVAKIAVLNCIIRATRDQKVESCVFRDLSMAAFELSVMIERGVTPRQYLTAQMDEANKNNKAAYKEAVERGDDVILNSISLTEDDIQVKRANPEDVSDA